MNTPLPEDWKNLGSYTACDIADALLKLNVPGAGFLADITPIRAHSSQQRKIIAPASTFLMVPKPTPSFPNPSPVPPELPPSNAASTPYADQTQRDTIVLISQPDNQSCAVLGGIMATRIQRLGGLGIVVSGRVRDLSTLRTLDIPVWSKGSSVIGAGAETKFYAQEVEIRVGETRVVPGDIVLVDEEERGVVCVPRGLVKHVLEMLPQMVRGDGLALAEVEQGGSVAEAFKKHRA